MAVLASSVDDQGESPLPESSQRPCVVSGVLFAGRESPLPAGGLADECASRVTDHLEHVADWADSVWKVGDSNSYVIATTLASGEELVSVFSSEPLEDVRWRITGGGTELRRDLMERFGFAASGDTGRWERDVRIQSPRDAAAVARDLIALLTEYLGYSGQTPLTFALTLARRGEPGLVYRALSPGDLRKLLQGWGYRAELGTTVSGNPVIRSGTGGYKFHILFAWPGSEGPVYGCLNFVTVFAARQALTLDAVNDISRSSRFSRLYLDDDGDLILERDVSLTGGVAAGFVQECLLDWACMMESVRKKLDKLMSPPVVMH